MEPFKQTGCVKKGEVSGLKNIKYTWKFLTKLLNAINVKPKMLEYP